MSILEKLKDGLINGYIDKTRLAEEEYKPKLIINDVEKSEKGQLNVSISMLD